MTLDMKRFLSVLAVAGALGAFALGSGRAVAAPGGAFDDARRALEAALGAKDAPKVREALHAVAKDDSERAVKLLAAASGAGLGLDIYDDLVEALGSMRSEAAVREVTRTAASDSDWSVRYLFVEALAAIDRPEARKVLFAAFEDKHELVAGNAMRACRAVRLKEAVRPLIAVLEKFERRSRGAERLKREAVRALSGITGASLETSGDWQRFWDQNEASFDPKAEAAKKAKGEETGTVIRRVVERGEYDFVEKLEKGDIVVVQGASDECEKVLDILKLPYTLVSRAKAAETVLKIDPRSVLVFDCEGDLENGVLKGQAAKALAAFVERGGYLFTSDWGLAEEIQPALPGYLGVGPMIPEGEEFDVKIAPSRGVENHPYLRDVFPDNPYDRARMKWKIDNMAFTIRMTPKAMPLIESTELGSRFSAPVVAATFRHGKGAVLHVMGHFKCQMDASGDAYALQQLLVNFIVEKQKFRRKAKGG